MPELYNGPLLEQYDNLMVRKERVQQLDDIVAEVDADWGTASVEKKGSSLYDVTFTFLISQHGDVFPIINEVLEWEETKYSAEVVEDTYLKYTATVKIRS